MPEIKSSIVEVTVFPDRARVTRRGSVEVEPGTHRLLFPELPLGLTPESVRASGRGTAGAALLGVDTKKVYYTESPSTSVHDLEQQIEALSDEDRVLADAADAAAMQAGLVKSLADRSAAQLARSLAREEAAAERGEAALGFLRQQLSAAQARGREIGVQRRELNRKMTRLKNELQQISPGPLSSRQRYQAEIEVEVSSAGQLSIDLLYVLPGAGWQALYDIRLEQDEKPSLQLTYLAQVTQSTGEEWQDVALTLSTARPALAGVQPKLYPWYLDDAQPSRTMMRRAVGDAAPGAVPPPPPPAPAAAAPAQAPAAMPVMLMEARVAEVSSSGASVTFKTPQPVSIPSDGAPHKVNVAVLEFVPDLDYITVPKLAECAYRRARVHNQSDFLLLAGQANLFVSGDFIGATRLAQVAPGEEFELTLGVDDRVFVKRELKARDVDKKLLADRRRIRIAYETEIRNLSSHPIRVELHDQAPVSRHEQIKVRLESTDPRPSEQSELQELEWQLTLEPGGQRKVRFDFTVEHPAHMEVSGLG